jgi:hypothetical protein
VNRIKVFFLQRAINQQLSKLRNADLPSIKKVYKIVVLLGEKQSQKIEGMEAFLNQKFKVYESKFLILSTRKSNSSEDRKNIVAVSRHDFTFFGKLKHEKVHQLLDQKSDLFIDLTFDSTIYGHYLLSFQQAAFKVGFASHSEKLVDLYLRMPDEADEIKCLTVFWDYFLRLNGVNYE